MNVEVALYWTQETLQTAAMIVAPVLLAALVVGLIVSLFQAVTSIQEMTLSYIPKIMIAGLVIFLLSPWILQTLTEFATNVITFIPAVSE